MNKSTWIMILLTWFLGNLSIHFMTPALPELVNYFHTNTRIAQMTISIFLLGKALSMLLWSSLAQRIGRKPVFTIGLALYSLSNLAAALTHSALIFLSCRFSQGLAVGATLLMGRVMINDTHDEQQATFQFARLFSLGGLFICSLPFLGGLINSYGNWQIASGAMAAYGLLLLLFCPLLPETKPQLYSTTSLRTNMIVILSNRLFLRYLFISALMMAGESAFNTSASFILIQGAHYSTGDYGSIKTLMALMHLSGTAACGLLIRHTSNARLVVFGVRIFAFSTGLMWLFSLTDSSILWTFIVPMMIYYFGTGFIVACTTAGACRPFPKQMATALALSLFGQFNCSALFSFITSVLAIHHAAPFMLLMTFISALSMMLWPNAKQRTQSSVTA